MPTEIGRAEVRRLLNDGALLVEVLPAEEYQAEHIAGAVNIPLDRIDPVHLAGLARDRPVIVYCNDFQ